MTVDPSNESGTGKPALKFSALLAGAGVMVVLMAMLGIERGGDARMELVADMAPIVGIVIAIVAGVHLGRINRNPARLAGGGWAKVDLWCGVATVPVFLVMFVITSRTYRDMHENTACAANITGVLKAMLVYANENNDCMPITTPAAEPWTYQVGFGVVSTGKTQEDAAKEVQGRTGSVDASFWMLVLDNSISPKSLICRYDPWGEDHSSPVQVGEKWLLSPQKSSQLSYSIAYPWELNKDGKMVTGSHWNNSCDSSVPLMSDMAPRLASPPPVGGDMRPYNSPNHGGDGQNVGFGDAHTEWVRTPVMENGDNIWTAGKAGADRVVMPGRVPVPGFAKDVPDVMMVPVRDGKTGKVE